jgi:hypothetical protein
MRRNKPTLWEVTKLHFRKIFWHPKVGDKLWYWESNSNWKIVTIEGDFMPPCICTRHDEIKIWVREKYKDGSSMAYYADKSNLFPYLKRRK